MPARLRRLRSVLSGLGSLAAVLLLAILAQLLFASHGRPPVLVQGGSRPGGSGPLGTPTPTVIALGTWQSLNAISTVSPDEGWAAGSMTDCATPDSVGSRALLYHYQHGQWSPVLPPSIGTVSALQMLSASEGWVVTGSNTLAHYQNGQWSAQTISSVPGISGDASVDIRALRMLSPTAGWAVGEAMINVPQPQPPAPTTNMPQPLPTGIILRYDGSQWRVASTYAHASFTSIGLLAPDQGWIGGGGDYFSLSAPYKGWQGSNPLLLTLTDGAWTGETPLNLPGDTSLVDSVSAQPGAGAWLILNHAGGGAVSEAGGTPTALGGQWVAVPMPAIPNRDSLRSVWMVSPDEGWAVGSATWPSSSGQSAGLPNTVTPLILHYLRGTWSIVAS
jgi:hypothetical protein